MNTTKLSAGTCKEESFSVGVSSVIVGNSQRWVCKCTLLQQINNPKKKQNQQEKDVLPWPS